MGRREESSGCRGEKEEICGVGTSRKGAKHRGLKGDH